MVFKDAGGAVLKTIEYVYDVDDRRIGKKASGVVLERYVYDGSDIALVFDGAGNQTHRYLYGTGVDQILADERGASVVWALADDLGTVRDVVDGGGVVLNHVTYDSYGRVISVTNPAVEFRYGFTGREQDSETGLEYYRARYYDSAVGRFISEDPIGFAAGDTNIYRYVGNSPTNFTDPSGNNPLLVIWGGLTAGQWLGIGAVGVGGLGTAKQLYDASNPKPSPFVETPLKPTPIPTPTTPPLIRPLPRPTPVPVPVPVPDPNCPPKKKKETCATKYSGYSTILDLNNAKYRPFGGFQFNTVGDAKIELQNIRTNHSNPAYRSGKTDKYLIATNERYFDNAILYGCKTPSKGSHKPLHYDAITTETILREKSEQVSGGSLGYCKICVDSNNGPTLINQYSILNVKDRSGNMGTHHR